MSLDGGTEPRWARDGELFYRQGNAIVAVELRRGEALTVARRTTLFEIDAVPGAFWDVHPDGDRFVMIRDTEESGVVLVQNFFEELNRLVPN